jgi:carboxyl-terminal processing protease
MPDYFIPVDTAKYTQYHRSLAANGSINQASLRYLDENREKLNALYPTIEDFEKYFEIDETFIDILRQQGANDNVTPENEEEFERSLPELKIQMKQFIARDLWDISNFMKFYNKDSDSFKKAYELIQDKKFKKLMIK